MSEYDAEYWKHGLNITAEQFCDYVKKNISFDAVLYICGNNNVNLHFSSKSNILSVDYDALADLPEYEGYDVEEFGAGVSL